MKVKAQYTADANGCWIWNGAKDRDGYGKRKGERSHRYYYRILRGPIPAGLDLDHLCRNKICCNPAHLEPVTRTENERRKNIALKDKKEKDFVNEYEQWKLAHPIRQGESPA